MDDLDLEIDQSEHTAKLRFVTVPVTDAHLKMYVTTVDENGEVAAKYLKEFLTPITFNQGNLKSFGVVLIRSKDYTAKYTPALKTGSNNSYSGNCDITLDDIIWNVTGNSTIVNEWRLGGKNILNVDRTVYSKTPYPKELWKVDLRTGADSGPSAITVNSLKLVYSTNEDFSDSKEISKPYEAEKTINFEADFPANCYYKFVFNLTVPGGANKFVRFLGIEFFGYSEE